MKRFYGTMDYFASGEGVTNIYYVGWAKDADSFRQFMIAECQIDSYFYLGLAVSDTITEDTPPLIVEYFRRLKKGAGFMKFHSHINYS